MCKDTILSIKETVLFDLDCYFLQIYLFISCFFLKIIIFFRPFFA